jgi:predicted flap endonuclease-1-like 5' DNA nuclease
MVMSVADPHGAARRGTGARRGGNARGRPGRAAGGLPLSKLRGVPLRLRRALKAHRITSCDRLLAAAAAAPARAALAAALMVDEATLRRLVQRADMSRVVGIGAVFGMMLEDLGVLDVGMLAAADAEALHERLRRLNTEERIARRAPTPEEVRDWIRQAAALPKLVG